MALREAAMTMDTSQPGEFYLWHLERINLLSKSQNTYVPSQEWLGSLRDIETKVAIIDSGCTTRHPNLPKTAIDPAIDFAVNPEGAVYSVESVEIIRSAWAKIETRLGQLGVTHIPVDVKMLIDSMNGTAPEVFTIDDPAEQFSAHGTACAGLVAGRTLKETAATAQGINYGNDAVLNYFGVNPTARIIPVATGYNYEVEPISRALLHAIGMGADVILMPRHVSDWSGVSYGEEKDNLRHTRLDADQKLKDADATFKRLLAMLAPVVPVILAAGNDGLGTIAYPASLVEEPEPGFKDLIVVGAANSKGHRSSYSSGLSREGIAVFAPSDDEERIDKTGTWFNPDDNLGRQIAKLNLNNIRNYSPFGVLALEVPGRLGGPDDGQEAPLQLSDLYRIFGGTSAASSIIAGLASLVAAQHKEAGKHLTGQAFRELLRKQQAPAASVAAGAQSGVATAPSDDTVRIVDARKLLGSG
jgi:subtilisin family serine protease